MGSVAVHRKTEAVGELRSAPLTLQLRRRRFFVRQNTHHILYAGAHTGCGVFTPPSLLLCGLMGVEPLHATDVLFNIDFLVMLAKC